jgi:hypothetical protein
MHQNYNADLMPETLSDYESLQEWPDHPDSDEEA